VRENSERMQALLDALRQGGVADRYVRTTMLRVQPQWAGKNKKSIDSYIVSNGVTVKLTDMERVGNVLEALGSAANSIGQLTFAAEYPEKELEALGAALQDAYARARKIAEASGCGL